MGGVDELEDVWGVGKAGDPAVPGADATAQAGSDLDGEPGAGGAGGDDFAAEADGSFFRGVALDELADLVDDGEGVQVALALGLAPGEKAVAAQDDAVAAGVFADCEAHRQAQFKAGTLPGKPDEGVVELAIEFFHFGLAVGGGGQSDAPVGVKMIDVGEGKKAVQRGVNGGGDRIRAEGAEGVHGDHAVFGVNAFVEAFEGQQLLLVEGGKAGALDAAQVAAGAFDPEDFDRLAGKGVDFSDFGTGVAAGKVGDAEVGAEQVGAIAEQAGFVEGGGLLRVPAVFKKRE